MFFIFILVAEPRTKTDRTVLETWITTEVRIVRALHRCTIRADTARVGWRDERAITGTITCPYRARTCPTIIYTSPTRPSWSGGFWRGKSARARVHSPKCAILRLAIVQWSSCLQLLQQDHSSVNRRDGFTRGIARDEGACREREQVHPEPCARERRSRLRSSFFFAILVFCIPNVNKLHRGHDVVHLRLFLLD